MSPTLSLYLDLLRFVAAALVFLSHANYERLTGGLPVLWRLSGLGNDAVMIFFVLSGFVIAYVSDGKEPRVGDYFLSRFARLLSVTVPAIVLTGACDWAGHRLAPALYEAQWYTEPNVALRVLAGLFFVNELWLNSVRLLSNGPFWSIGYEFWYYVAFAAFAYFKGPARPVLALLVLLVAGPKIVLLLPIWGLGVVLYRQRERIARLPSALGWLALVASALLYGLYLHSPAPGALLDWSFRWLGEDFVRQRLLWSSAFLSDYIVGALVALHFIGAMVLGERLRGLLWPVARHVHYLASFTFALYLFHYPLLQFFAALAEAAPALRPKALVVIGATLVGVWALGTVTEHRKSDVKRALARAARALHQRPGGDGMPNR